jgi:hypothetical protein
MAESGALAPLQFDAIPETFTAAFVHLIDQGTKVPRVGGSSQVVCSGVTPARR